MSENTTISLLFENKRLIEENSRLRELVKKLGPWYEDEKDQTRCIYCEQKFDWMDDNLGHLGTCKYITRERK